LRPGSGLGLGFGAFLTSFLPLSLLPMATSMTQKASRGKERICRMPFRVLSPARLSSCLYFFSVGAAFPRWS
jgi:hypothetical protein